MATVPTGRIGGVRKCTVVWCKNTAGKKKGYGVVSLHRFPVEKKFRKIWINRCIKNGKLWKSSTVCSIHFKPDAFEGDLTETTVGQQIRKCLKPDALPTLFLKKSQFNQSKTEDVETKPEIQTAKPKKLLQQSDEELPQPENLGDSDSLVVVTKVETLSSNKRRGRKKLIQGIKSGLSKTPREKGKSKIIKRHISPLGKNNQKFSGLKRKVRFNFNTRGRPSRVPRNSPPALKRNKRPSMKKHDEKMTASEFDPKVMLERIFIPSKASTSSKKAVTWEAEDISSDFDLRYTMNEPTSDPLDIAKSPELVKDAQKTLGTTDVLICGGCHEVFYFVEEFQSHKDSKTCGAKSVLKCENEEKAQIWGFTLWKTKQAHIHREKGEAIPNSWDVYQKWTKLQPNEKDLWVTAGHNLQVISKISTTKYKEAVKDKDKDPLSFEDGSLENGSPPKRGVRSTANDSERHEYNVEKIVGKRFNTRKHLWEYEVKWENYAQESWEPLSNLENCKAMVQQYEAKIKVVKEKEKPTPSGRGRGRPRLHPLPTSGAVTTPTVKLIKKSAITSSPVIVTSPGSRPQRTSKQKALNQVKAWCGNISDEEEGTAKRSLDDDDEDDSDGSYVKKMKVEAESEDTEEEELKSPAKKVAKLIRSYHNGNVKKLPDNVLIPDSKGIVRISQKQLPSLSSGVYIMSRSSGIIKLDPTASKMATSGGQAIVTVSPKIGQTQIRIIKKDDGSKRTIPIKTETGGNVNSSNSSTLSKASVSTPKLMQNVVTSTTSLSPPKKSYVRKDGEKLLKKVEPPVVKSATPKPTVTIAEAPKVIPTKEPTDDESDDGIEEMEFPTDLPLPSPDSPPGDFVLDPITGKVFGVEYPDPEPEPVIIDQIKEPTESIDNIVKLAAADITEEDLKTDDTVNSTTVTQTATPETVLPTPKITAPSITAPTITATVPTTKTLPPILSEDSLISSNIMTVTTKPIVTPKPSPAPTVYSVVTHSKPKPSILNTALKNSNILQKTLQSPKPRTQPRIINQSVAKPKGTISPIVRTHAANTPRPQLVKPRPQMSSTPKPKFNISPPVSSHVVKQLYSKTPGFARKVSHPGVQKPKPSPSVHSTPVRKPSLLAKSPVATPAPKPVINMPSLDDEPALVLATPTKSEQVVEATVAAAVETDISTFTLAADDRPMFITGDDGTVYQVAGQNEDGQTILVTQDSDGQQQCLLVTNDSLQDEVEQVEFPAEMYMAAVQEQEAPEAEEQPVVAQFLRTEPISPGGTCRVVVRLPDGEVMVTQVSPEEYASLQMDK